MTTATKTYRWIDAEAIEIRITDGPAAGTYTVTHPTVVVVQGQSVIHAGYKGSQRVMVRVADLAPLATEIAERETAAAARYAAETDVRCERCLRPLGKLADKRYTLIPGSYRGHRTMDPHCTECVTLLRATSGYGEAPITGVIDTDRTPETKED